MLECLTENSAEPFISSPLKAHFKKIWTIWGKEVELASFQGEIKNSNCILTNIFKLLHRSSADEFYGLWDRNVTILLHCREAIK